ncbi:MAG TPA: hypothetical protein VJ596_09630 [Gemmatimonadaceae bacterium]|nr:hypothetical protein [Gemmatimonadaceae bacterium]
MRILGSVLMAIGTFLLLAALLSLVTPQLQYGRAGVTGRVSSFELTVLAGVILLGGGALMRRRARRASRVVPPAR